MNAIENKLLESASRTLKNAYAPYSNFLVGASIETPNGNIYAGCNVENASYGLTMCAEASAIANMITAGETCIRQITVVTDGSGKPSGPCGACRQKIYEFAESIDIPVHMHNLSGKQETKTLNELLPYAFGPKDLI